MTNEKKAIRTGASVLECGCCGEPFRTRPEYTDQDQDEGFGICRECQGLEEERNAEEYAKMFKVLFEGLNEENKKKCLKDIEEKGEERKIVLVNIGLENGRFEFGFEKSN